MSVVLIAYEMSRKIANTGSIQLVIGGAVVAGICRFHSSLAEVIWVQIVMMAILLFCVAIPFLLPRLVGRDETRFSVPGIVRLRRSVSENEVIAEFLRNDFEAPEFAEYRRVLERLVVDPDIEDDQENSVRRALFSLRHGQLWRELPQDTEWFEADIRTDDLDRLRVFPRAQWRKLALGDYGLARIANRVNDVHYRERATTAFLDKIDNLRDHLKAPCAATTVLLIGTSESGPFTILDGNHRLVAAMLTSHDALERFRFFCGLSPRMIQCCWHQTNLRTLMRYGTNMFRHYVRNPEAELMQALHQESAKAEAV